MIITCKCLNVSLDLGKFKPKGIALSSLKLSTLEEAQEFFAEGVAEVETVNSIIKKVPALTRSVIVGNWIIDSCINCALPFFAKHKDERQASLISAGLVADPNTMLMLKSMPEFSPVFNIVIKDSSKMSNILDTNTVKTLLSGLQQQLANAVKAEAEVTDEKIRSYTDQQHELLAAFRDRAVRDHDAIVKILNRAELVKTTSGNLTDASGIPAVDQTTPKSQPRSMRTAVGRSQSVFSPSAAVNYDTEGVFNLDEMEDTTETNASDIESDTDHDDSSSHDEGIEIRRKKSTPLSLARSLPVSVPAFAATGLKLMPVDIPGEIYDSDEPAPADIAASIKALARSVHNDVFGDLPRPRFSTNI